MAKIARKTLTDKESKFVAAYLRHFNAARAAREAGYSVKTARQTGHENLTKPHIRDAIRKALDEEGITAERVKVEAASIAFGGDIGEVEEFIRSGKSLRELAEGGANIGLVKSISVTPNPHGESRSLTLHSKLEALRLLAQCLAMLTERQEHSGGITVVRRDFSKLPLEEGECGACQCRQNDSESGR